MSQPTIQFGQGESSIQFTIEGPDPESPGWLNLAVAATTPLTRWSAAFRAEERAIELVPFIRALRAAGNEPSRFDQSVLLSSTRYDPAFEFRLVLRPDASLGVRLVPILGAEVQNGTAVPVEVPVTKEQLVVAADRLDADLHKYLPEQAFRPPSLARQTLELVVAPLLILFIVIAQSDLVRRLRPRDRGARRA